MRKLLLTLLILSFATIAYADWVTYDFDFEDGTYETTVVDEAEADMGILDVNSTGNVVFDSAKAQSGSYSCRLDVPAGSEGTIWSNCGGTYEIDKQPVSEGDEIWMHIDLFIESGFDFTPYDSTKKDEVKLHRVDYTDSSSDNDYKGMTGIMLIYYNHAGVRSFASLGGQAPSGADYYLSSNINSYMSENEWHSLDLYVCHSYVGNGILTLTQDGVVKTTTGLTTLQASATHYRPDSGVLAKVWNSGLQNGGTLWVDNAYFSLEVPYGGSAPAPDSTAPSVSGLNPADNETGVSLTADPFIQFVLNDAGGVDLATLSVLLDGNEESGDVTHSGTNTSYTCDIDLGDIDITPANDTVYGLTIEVDDIYSNSLTQTTYFTMASASAGTTWADGATNDRANYTELDSEKWGVIDDSGDDIYSLVATEYDSPGTGAFGEYTLYATEYSGFDMTVEVRCDETLGTNPYADFGFIVDYQNSGDYVTINCSQASGNNAILYYSNGSNVELASIGEALITDNNFDTHRVVLDNQVLTYYFNGVQKAQVTNHTFGTGQVGFGSYNDAFSIDDVAITSLDSNPDVESAPPSVKLAGACRWYFN